jgi:hypothetical protein
LERVATKALSYLIGVHVEVEGVSGFSSFPPNTITHATGGVYFDVQALQT